MRILLLGGTGQVGWELQRSLATLGEVTTLPRSAVDLENPDTLAEAVRAVRPDVIVSAAAHTAVDKAESEAERAHRINAEAPGVLAEEAARLGALLVHYSTDYVFDGGGTRPWSEADTTGPLSVYGSTKLEGEQRIQASGCRHMIFRTSWVYAARGGNFARTMLRLARDRERLTVIDDQWGAPTGADLIADVTAHAIRGVEYHGAPAGLYHLVAGGETTWHGYASHVIAQARVLQPDMPLAAHDIAAVPTSAFPTPARRPANSRMDTTRLQQAFQLRLPAWQAGVDRMLAEILETPNR
ncbi:dTDP-4-dehydrorhamnose reductase [Xylophilus ampelinus]|uniref:dTDP-4-dehydrorhamnose reductase n=1 Tax=Xylophilus ampelinus TaxID=54067 RepID=A0A318SND6_9BURK|nr:dTDP-4-dehydrorhamnose reductase [Xylophilus ampelinus]MCS4509763.1 dTDP-4-dehydrorhamnose reductase [Xylophilus ampelinus]PYE78709.1 dTDP-4-dehydrorhamnose reductase [Xylophilus ampelinus]